MIDQNSTRIRVHSDKLSPQCGCGPGVENDAVPVISSTRSPPESGSYSTRIPEFLINADQPDTQQPWGNQSASRLSPTYPESLVLIVLIVMLVGVKSTDYVPKAEGPFPKWEREPSDLLMFSNFHPNNHGYHAST